LVRGFAKVADTWRVVAGGGAVLLGFLLISFFFFLIRLRNHLCRFQ